MPKRRWKRLSNPLINKKAPAPIFGIVGWKNNGKTTLVVKLVEEFSRRGWRVATVKHAHHDFDIDHEGADSWHHAQAGAVEVAVVSSKRWALIHNNMAREKEPDLATILAKLEPCDLVLVEGYKQGTHPKIEVCRREGYRGKQGELFLAESDPQIIALAADALLSNAPPALPVFDLDDIAPIADFIERKVGI